MSTAQQALSQQQRDKFERDGYAIFDTGLPVELLDEVVRDTGELYRSAGIVSFSPGARMPDAWLTTPGVRQLTLAPNALAVAGELYGRKAMPFQTLNFPYGTQQGAHADAAHFNSNPPGSMCGIWIALEDVDMDNGPLVYYPGSHMLPSPTWDQITEAGFGLDKSLSPEEQALDRLRKYEAYCRHLIEFHGFQPEYGTIRKGQGLLWAANLLHGGSPQKDPARTRHSQVSHYLFDERPFDQPLWAAEDGRIGRHYPTWVRDPPPHYSTSAVRDAIEATVPAGSTVLVVGGDSELLEVEGRTAWHFPRPENGSDPGQASRGADAIDELERQRAQGAEYVVFPRDELAPLETSWTLLQDHLDDHYRLALCDGCICVVYSLS